MATVQIDPDTTVSELKLLFYICFELNFDVCNQSQHIGWCTSFDIKNKLIVSEGYVFQNFLSLHRLQAKKHSKLRRIDL